MGDLDDDLRRLFGDDRLDVHPAPDATDAVLRGAHRRRRRRAAISSAFLVVALVGVGLGATQLRTLSHDDPADELLETATSTASTTSPPPSTSTVVAPGSSGRPVTPPTSSGGNTTPPGTGSSKPRTTTPSPPPPPPAEPGRLGALLLGMSEADALATGALVEPSSPADQENRCKAYATRSVPDGDAVVISPAKGIVRITRPSTAKTQKNVGVGSTVAEVKAAYGTATQSGTTVLVPMAASPSWSYVFTTNGTTVTMVHMRLAAHDCPTA
ncbi:hypothetical protein V1227_27660 [Lentzea sp. DG1S-22]|uniref:hypothetical protein n=1 Tax=Lentzea sp. DG1S-22 TaxID=3108822 RepID=UPI002E793E7D|nr:hypothetical protein [Lentzea sp. DG1S-22]WVH78815.1 hypothetical protein V1227_27660 [Lentzea sp. DG1S-22]